MTARGKLTRQLGGPPFACSKAAVRDRWRWQEILQTWAERNLNQERRHILWWTVWSLVARLTFEHFDVGTCFPRQSSCSSISHVLIFPRKSLKQPIFVSSTVEKACSLPLLQHDYCGFHFRHALNRPEEKLGTSGENSQICIQQIRRKKQGPRKQQKSQQGCCWALPWLLLFQQSGGGNFPSTPGWWSSSR